MHSKRRYKICIRSVILRELPWAPEVFSRVRRGASFRRPQADTCSAEGRRHERRRPDRNLMLKPRMKSLWHPESLLEITRASVLFSRKF